MLIIHLFKVIICCSKFVICRVILHTYDLFLSFNFYSIFCNLFQQEVNNDC